MSARYEMTMEVNWAELYLRTSGSLERARLFKGEFQTGLEGVFTTP